MQMQMLLSSSSSFLVVASVVIGGIIHVRHLAKTASVIFFSIAILFNFHSISCCKVSLVFISVLLHTYNFNIQMFPSYFHK